MRRISMRRISLITIALAASVPAAHARWAPKAPLGHSNSKTISSLPRTRTILTTPMTDRSLELRGGSASGKRSQGGSEDFSPTAAFFRVVKDYVKPADAGDGRKRGPGALAALPFGQVWTVIANIIWNLRNEAAERRRFYRENNSLGSTAAAAFHPNRAVKLTLLAFVVAEVMHFVEQHPAMEDLQEKVDGFLTDAAWQLENFYHVGKAKGGLLRPETWSDGKTLSQAIQMQITPRYQVGTGAALGVVVSPLVWSVGWATVSATAGLVLVAHVHHLAKKQIPAYYEKLKEVDAKWLYWIDDFLEDAMHVTQKVVEKPKKTIFAWRDDISDRIDFDFPPHVQKGFVMGLVAGFVLGA